MRERWTDERMDDLNRRVDEGFSRVDEELRVLRTETKTEFAALRGEMNTRFDSMDARFDARFDGMEARLDSLQRTMVQFCGVMVAALVGLIGAQTVLFVTLL